MPGLDGLKKMAALMAGLREAPQCLRPGGVFCNLCVGLFAALAVGQDVHLDLGLGAGGADNQAGGFAKIKP